MGGWGRGFASPQCSWRSPRSIPAEYSNLKNALAIATGRLPLCASARHPASSRNIADFCSACFPLAILQNRWFHRVRKRLAAIRGSEPCHCGASGSVKSSTFARSPSSQLLDSYCNLCGPPRKTGDFCPHYVGPLTIERNSTRCSAMIWGTTAGDRRFQKCRNPQAPRDFRSFDTKRSRKKS
jgi:hypothetical protein